MQCRIMVYCNYVHICHKYLYRVVSSERVDNLDYQAITTVSKKLKVTSTSSSSSSSSLDDDSQLSRKVSKTLESSSKKQEYIRMYII